MTRHVVGRLGSLIGGLEAPLRPRKRPNNHHRATTFDRLEDRIALAPVISSASGSFTQGATMVLRGSGFGAKAQAAPYIQDGFENGFSSIWGAGNNNDLDIARLGRHPHSSSSAHLNFTASDRGGYLQAPSDRVAARWYVDYWFYLAPDWDWGTTTHGGDNRFLSNIKFARFWSPQSGVNENFVAAYAGWADSLIYNMDRALPM
jgi:hypothetical protein